MMGDLIIADFGGLVAACPGTDKTKTSPSISAKDNNLFIVLPLSYIYSSNTYSKNMTAPLINVNISMDYTYIIAHYFKL